MITQARAFLEAHGEARFTAWDAHPNDSRTANRAGYRRRTDSGPEYYVEAEAFRREVAKGYHPNDFARVLEQHGALLPESASRLTRKERLPDGRSTRVYRITPKLWNIEL